MRNAMNTKRKMTMAAVNGERCNHSVNREQSKDDDDIERRKKMLSTRNYN